MINFLLCLLIALFFNRTSKIREKIVFPLLTIQQYALKQIQELQKTEPNSKEIEVFEKMVMRSLFGNINASRNSA